MSTQISGGQSHGSMNHPKGPRIQPSIQDVSFQRKAQNCFFPATALVEFPRDTPLWSFLSGHGSFSGKCGVENLDGGTQQSSTGCFCEEVFVVGSCLK
jgi:hypothetical protein